MKPITRTAVVGAGLFCATAISLTLAGCAPPYLEGLDRAAPLTRQMTTVGSLGPISFGNTTTAMRFYPAKPAASDIGSAGVPAGFAVQESSGQEVLSFIAAGQNGSGSSVGLSLAGSDPNYPLYEYYVSATIASQASILVFKYDPTGAASTYAQYVALLPGGSMTSPTGTLTLTATNTIFTGNLIIGACDLPPPPATQDTFSFGGLAGGFLTTGTATLNGSATAFPVGGVMTASLATIPGSVGRYAFNSSTGTSYISVYNGSQWAVQHWVGAGAGTTMTGITHRIDGILTTGDLVSTEGGVLRLYDSTGAGTQLYAIPLDGLQYCYEAYVGSTPYVFFSLSMPVAHGDWVFNVYALPTSSMRSLGG